MRADFRDCIMQEVAFAGADLTGSNFVGAVGLDSVDFHDAIGLDSADIPTVYVLKSLGLGVYAGPGGARG